MRIGGGFWEDVAETIGIVRAPCRFGGVRPYFICPGVVNGVARGERVTSLHGPGRYFLRRHCRRLAHASQREGARDCALRRADKIRGFSESVFARPVSIRSHWAPRHETLRRLP